MAGNNTNITGGAGKKGPAQSGELQRAQAAQQQVFDALGVDPSALGPKAQDEARQMLAAFQSKPIDERLLSTATRRLTTAVNEDAIAAFNPGDAPHYTKSANWETASAIKEDRGVSRLTGAAAGEGHPVAQLLAKLGIDKNNLSPNVLDTLNHAMERGTPLGRNAEYQTFARELMRAKARDTGGLIKTGAAQTTARATGPSTQSGLTESSSASVTRNAALEANAPTTTGNGSRTGAMAALMQNLSSAKTRQRGSRNGVGELASVFAREAGIEDLSPADTRALEKTLSAVIKDPASVDGSIRPSAVAANAYAELAKAEQAAGAPGAYSLASTMMCGLHDIVKTQPELSPEVENLMANLATASLTDLVGSKLGQTVQPQDEVFAKISSTLASLGNHAEAPEPPSSEARDAATASGAHTKTKTAGTDAAVEEPAGTDATASNQGSSKADAPRRKPVSPEAREYAAKAMTSLNLEPNNPAAAKIRAAFEDVFEQGLEPEKVAVNSARKLDEMFGTQHAAKVDKLVTEHPEPGFVTSMANKGLAGLAMAVANPEGYKTQFLANANASGAGIGNGLGGNGMAGVPAGFGTGGILGPGSPGDADGAKNDIYLQRTMVVSSILNDPSLSIEDKIFYFMMWFAAFADKEREQKMREIADLDRVNQQKDMMKKAIYRDRQALFQTRKELTRAVDRAEDDVNKLNPNAVKIADAEKKLSRLEARLPAPPEKIEAAQAKVAALDANPNAKAEDKQAAAAELKALQKQGTPDPQKISALEARIEDLEKSNAKPAKIDRVKKQLAALKTPPDASEVSNLKTQIAQMKQAGGATGEQAAAAQQKLQDVKRKLAECNGAIEEKSAQFDQLKNETDQAPKSRELLFMELERIQRFRGMLIDMANSFMRDMARRVKEIMQ